MTVDEVKALPLREKIQIMETIWEDFRDRLESSQISREQAQLLSQRRSRADLGVAKIHDWDSVKGKIGS